MSGKLRNAHQIRGAGSLCLPSTRLRKATLALALLNPPAALLTLARIVRAARPGRSPAAPASTFVVTKTVDTGDGSCDADCSLREAVTDARAAPGPDTITFDLPPGSTIVLGGNQLPTITDTLTIDGATADGLTVSGDGASRILEISSGTAVTVTALTFADGWASGTFREDSGAIYNDGGTLAVYDSAFYNNWTEGYGGAIYNYGTATVRSSTFGGNTAYLDGGAVRTDGAFSAASNTFSGNSARFDGGAIYNVTVGDDASTLLLRNNTFTLNAAGDEGGGLYNSAGSELHFSNNIIANSLGGGDCVSAGTTVANVANLVEDGACAADLSGDPLLGPLQDNGGPTHTHALPAASPAVDAGNNAACALPGGADNRDQRGRPRPADGNRDGVAVCDIGAFELQPEWAVALPLILQVGP